MHELAITQAIVETACEHAAGAKIVKVILEIGKLTAVMPDSVRFCFELCCADTAAEGATLEIVEPPGLGKCRACGAQMTLDEPFGQCSCGSFDLELLSGEQLRVRAMEVI